MAYFRIPSPSLLWLLRTTFLVAVFAIALRCNAQSAPSNPSNPSPDVSSIANPIDPDAMKQELTRLADICKRFGLVDQAEICEKWLPATSFDATTLYLPEEFPEEKLPKANPIYESWHKHFVAARQRHARYWFAQAQTLAKDGDEWNAYRSLWRCLREDPEHTEARRVLGPLVVGLTVKAKPRSTNVPHAVFGWPAGSYQRLETSNFSLASRATQAETLAIAGQLERYYALWTQAFFPLWAPPNVVTQRLAGRNTAWQPKRELKVVLLKDRDDYLKTLGVTEANIGVSVGYFNPEQRMSFFYPSGDLNATLFHEVTHQLFAQVARVDAKVDAGNERDYWLLEGVALYMESLQNHGTYWSMGGWLSPRLQAARYRAIHDGLFVEWAKFSQGGLDSWKSDSQVAVLYTQAAGMTHLFMDQSFSAEEIDRDHSRELLLKSLISVYQGLKPSQDLDRILKARSDEALEETKEDAQQSTQNVEQRAYVNFLLVRDQHLETIDPNASPRELVLCRSRLSSPSWSKLAQFKQLRWLDLSFSNATPVDLSWIAELKNLERLSLEGLTLDADVVRQIAKLPSLNELDLSECNVDDAMLTPLRGHPALTTIWLTRTRVSDKSLSILDSMKNLTFVEINGTSIGSESWKAFLGAHPKIAIKP